MIDTAKQNTIIGMVKEACHIHWNAIAIVDEQTDQSMSYRKLERKFHSLADVLIVLLNYEAHKTINPIVLHAMKAPFPSIVAFLAILQSKAGMLSLPFQTDQEYEQLDITTYKAQLLIVDEATADQIRRVNSKMPPMIILDVTGEIKEICDAEMYENFTFASQTVFADPVVYVSCGHLTSNKNLVQLITSFSSYLQVTDHHTVLSLTPFHSEGCLLEIFLPLIAGGTLVLGGSSSNLLSQPDRLITTLSEKQITIFQGSMTLFKLLLENGWNGSSILQILIPINQGNQNILETKQVPSQLLTLVTRCDKVHLVYGFSQTTSWCGVQELTSAIKLIDLYNNNQNQLMISIGKPIHPEIQFHVLNDQMRPVKDGQPGELYISGNSVCEKGYLFDENNHHHLNLLRRERIMKWNGMTIFRTGDIVVKRVVDEKAMPTSQYYFMKETSFITREKANVEKKIKKNKMKGGGGGGNEIPQYALITTPSIDSVVQSTSSQQKKQWSNWITRWFRSLSTSGKWNKKNKKKGRILPSVNINLTQQTDIIDDNDNDDEDLSDEVYTGIE